MSSRRKRESEGLYQRPTVMGLRVVRVLELGLEEGLEGLRVSAALTDSVRLSALGQGLVSTPCYGRSRSGMLRVPGARDCLGPVLGVLVGLLWVLVRTLS